MRWKVMLDFLRDIFLRSPTLPVTALTMKSLLLHRTCPMWTP